MDYPIQAQGLGSNHQMTERDIYDCQLPDGIGVKWKDLARALGYSQAFINAIKEDKSNSTRECCIELLWRWLGREGRDATAGRLAEALKRIELKKLADNLIRGPNHRPGVDTKELTGSNDVNQVSRCEKLIIEMTNQLSSLKEEVSKMRAKNTKLEEELLCAWQENSKLRLRIKELEVVRQQEKERAVDDLESPDSGRDLDVPDTAVREYRMMLRLEKLNKQLVTYVTSPLQVPEVNQDKLKTPVRLDLLTRLSERLQELYSETQAMLAEACKCGEDLKKDFNEFAFLGLRAEHNDLIHKVEDLGSVKHDMSEEEKKDFERLQGYQINRQRQVDRLEKLWSGLFSPLVDLPKASVSAPSLCDNPSNRMNKAVRRTDPGTRRRQIKPRDEPSTCSEDSSTNHGNDHKYKMYLNITNPSVKLSFFPGKENDENRAERRDS